MHRSRISGAAWLERFTKEPQNGALLFYAGLGIFLFRYVIVTTMFPFSGAMSVLCIGIFALLMLAKILLFDDYTVKQFAIAAGMLGCGLAITVSSGYVHPVLWLLLVVAAKGVPYRKILQMYLVVNIAIVGLAFAASRFDLIEDLVYTAENGMDRNSFGCVYTTDFAAHIFYLLMTAYYLWHDSLRWYHYLGTCAVAGLIYYFCRAKLDTICILLLVLFFGVYRILQVQDRRECSAYQDTGFVFRWQRRYSGFQRLCKRAAVVALPFAGVLMYCLTYFWNGEGKALDVINETITGRLRLGKEALEMYGISLFGQDVPMVGMGGSLELEEPYFFVDCSYLFVLLRYGLVFLLLLFVIYGVICRRAQGDTALHLVVILLAVSCSIDHHLMEGAYNPFGYALFAAGLGGCGEREAGQVKSLKQDRIGFSDGELSCIKRGNI